MSNKKYTPGPWFSDGNKGEMYPCISDDSGNGSLVAQTFCWSDREDLTASEAEASSNRQSPRRKTMSQPCKYNCGCCDQSTGSDGLCDECRDCQWTSVHVVLPKDSLATRVLVGRNKSIVTVMSASFYGGKFMVVSGINGMSEFVEPTHWMPLPQLPTEQTP